MIDRQKFRKLVTAIAAASGLIQLGVACTGDSKDDAGGSTCSAGDTRSCACPGGVDGVQTCRADGSGYASCQECPSSGAEDSGMNMTSEEGGTTTTEDGGTTTTESGLDGGGTATTEDSGVDGGGNSTTELVYDDSCASAMNGICDVPPTCADGTDITDCGCTSEDNTTPETAIDLGAIDDCDPSTPYTQYATLTGAPGSQFFKFTGNDAGGCIVDPEITVASINSLPGLCVYADCGPQGGTVTCNTFETAVSLETDTLGTLSGCCADDASTPGATPTISCTGSTDSADVYIEITSETSECAGFLISYRY